MSVENLTNKSINLVTILGSPSEQFFKDVDDKLASAFGIWHVIKANNTASGINTDVARQTQLKSLAFKKKQVLVRKIKVVFDYLFKENSELNTTRLNLLEQQLLKIYDECFYDEYCLNIMDEIIQWSLHIQIECIDVVTKEYYLIPNAHSFFWINLEKLVQVYYPNLAKEVQKGICFGLSSTFANAVLSNDLPMFLNRLRVISMQEPWLFMGKFYTDLSNAIKEAYQVYISYSKSKNFNNLNAKQVYENFRIHCPDAFFLMELRAWMEHLILSQMSCRTPLKHQLPTQMLAKQFNFIGSNSLMALLSKNSKESCNDIIHETQFWPVPLHKRRFNAFIQNLPNGIYFISTWSHTIAIYIDNEQLLTIDQNYDDLVLCCNKHDAHKEAEIFNLLQQVENLDCNGAILGVKAITQDQESMVKVDRTLKQLTFTTRKNFDDQYQLKDLDSENKYQYSQIELSLKHCNYEALAHLLTDKKHYQALINNKCYYNSFALLRIILRIRPLLKNKTQLQYAIKNLFLVINLSLKPILMNVLLNMLFI